MPVGMDGDGRSSGRLCSASNSDRGDDAERSKQNVRGCPALADHIVGARARLHVFPNGHMAAGSCVRLASLHRVFRMPAALV